MWQCWSENLTDSAEREKIKVPSLAPLEQLNVTNDSTDYLFYSTVVVDLPATTSITLDGWRSNAYIVMADGEIVASFHDASHDYDTGNISFTVPLSKTLQVVTLFRDNRISVVLDKTLAGHVLVAHSLRQPGIAQLCQRCPFRQRAGKQRHCGFCFSRLCRHHQQRLDNAAAFGRRIEASVSAAARAAPPG
jgi:hypothetical protein